MFLFLQLTTASCPPYVIQMDNDRTVSILICPLEIIVGAKLVL